MLLTPRTVGGMQVGIIFIGPIRGELLLPTNEKHIVPHIGTLAGSLVLLAPLL